MQKKSSKIKAIKSAIKNGSYNWEKAIAGAASTIVDNPQVLTWR